MIWLVQLSFKGVKWINTSLRIGKTKEKLVNKEKNEFLCEFSSVELPLFKLDFYDYEIFDLLKHP